MRLLSKSPRARTSRLPLAPRAFPRLEQLESRIVPYAVSGNAWPHPELVTLSFMPDGTNLGGAASNLFASFNAKWATSTWQNQILKAAQVWAQQTNLNFSVVSDNGADAGWGNYQQGDPTFGDIRIGGSNFGTSTLAMAYMPPPVNNYPIAGDFSFNTGQTFNIGSTFDLFTVATHEIGHALGLYHSSLVSAVMYSTYMAKMTGLGSDDIAGIRNIYSSNNARSYDAFNGANNGFTTAANLTGLIDANLTVLKTGLDITTTAQQEYFTITAPAGTNGTMTVTAQSSGLSLLAPTLTVYNAAQTQIGFVSGAGHYGTTLTLSISGVSAGQQFYVKVGGADTTAFGTGHYAMTFAFGTVAPAPVPLPNTQVLNGNPISGGGGMGEQAGDVHGRETAWDTFGETDDDDATPAKSPTANPAPTGNAQPTPSAYGPELAFVLAATSNQNATQVFAAATLGVVSLMPAAPTPGSPLVLSPSDLGRVESGGGSNSSEAVREENQAEQPAPRADEAVAPAPVKAERTESATEQTGLPSASSWRQACDAYFADEPRLTDSTGSEESTLSSGAEAVAAVAEPAAAVAMLMLLEGCWSAQPKQPDRPNRRLLSL